jgi:hypothetical protein
VLKDNLTEEDTGGYMSLYNVIGLKDFGHKLAFDDLMLGAPMEAP